MTLEKKEIEKERHEPFVTGNGEEDGKVSLGRRKPVRKLTIRESRIQIRKDLVGKRFVSVGLRPQVDGGDTCDRRLQLEGEFGVKSPRLGIGTMNCKGEPKEFPESFTMCNSALSYKSREEDDRGLGFGLGKVRRNRITFRGGR